jgi:nicotinate phosphoribosyltransferase
MKSKSKSKSKTEGPFTMTNQQLNQALLTDRYTLTMAQSFWKHGQAEDICNFDLFVRKLPAHRNYLVAAGLDCLISFLENWRFTEADLDYLTELDYDLQFIDYLRDLQFTGQVRAVAEGTILPAQAPILTMTAPRIQASILETALLTIINHQTMIASKTSRITNTVNKYNLNSGVWDFSLRRLHGLGAGINVARAAYLAGAKGTATVEAGRVYKIPTAGTMAHHFIQSFAPEDEQQAFEQFLIDYPDKNTLLVDTYDTLRGIKRAIAASDQTNVQLKGIRLDSGNLLELSIAGRKLLDQAGMNQTKIFASNDLDEYKINELLKNGAKIDDFGVGTMLGTSADAPYLGGVFKLTEQQAPGRPVNVMKLSSEKLTDPGQHQLWKTGEQEIILTLIDEQKPTPEAEPLLETVIENGVIVKRVDLQQAQNNYCQQIEALDQKYKEIEQDNLLELKRSEKLISLRQKLSRTTA